MNYAELLDRCESEIEEHLLKALHPELGPNGKEDIQAQYKIDIDGMPVTIPDFAFPSLQIAIYCDGYEYHWKRGPFQKDRQQSRDLQLHGWCVLRFAGREILKDPDAVVRTIEQAIRQGVQAVPATSAVVQAVVAYFNQPKFAAFFIADEVPIQMGVVRGLVLAIRFWPNSVKTRKADLVLRDGKGNFIAIAECKSPDGAIFGKERLKDYLSASGTRFGLFATSPNRADWRYCERKDGNIFVTIQQAVFEAGVLNGAPKPPKLDSIRIWRYVAAFLGVSLMFAIVLLLQTPKRDLPPPFPGEVVLIPAGEFQMGGSDSSAEMDELPVHTVHVDAFYIDKYEVTNGQYKKFVDANPQWQKRRIPSNFHNGKYLKLWQDNTYPPDKENHPVVYISWYAAMAYAKWTGRRLPTEAEWEYAARGGLVGATFSWGDDITPTMANYGGELGDTKPVGYYPPNGYELYDMTGNVMEWCLDAYDEGFYNHSPSHNPIAGRSLSDTVNNFLRLSDPRVVRSGCWYNVPMHVRVADRYGTSPDNASKGRGFRCAKRATDLSKNVR